MQCDFAVELLDELSRFRHWEQLNFLSHTLNRQTPGLIPHHNLEVRTTIVAILAHELLISAGSNRHHFPQRLLEQQVLKQNSKPELLVQRPNRLLLRLVEGLHDLVAV